MKPIRVESHPSILIPLAALLSLPLLAQAQPTAHYVPGVEGIKGASLPPPGLYVRDYNVAYFSSRLNDGSGHEVPGVDANAFIYANVPRVIWISDWQVLGGSIGVDSLLPLQYTDLDIKAGPNTVINNGEFGIGDLFAEAPGPSTSSSSIFPRVRVFGRQRAIPPLRRRRTPGWATGRQCLRPE